MRILHLMNGLEIGGRERVVLDLCERARSQGWEAEIALFDSPFRSLDVDFDPRDVPVHFLPRKPGIDLGFVRKLARLRRAVSADLLHAHNDTAVFYGGLAGLWGRFPVVGTYHTRPAATSRKGQLATRWASARAARLTTVSAELSERLVREGWARSLETIWNGIDLERFVAASPESAPGEWRSRLGVDAGSFLIGNVARFHPVKRQVDLIDAHRRLNEQDPRFELVLVGQGPTLESVRAHAERAGAPRGVRFLESTHDVAGLMRALDVFVLCSEHECAPRVLLEAMASSRVCLATAVGGMPEMLAPAGQEPAGVLVPAGSPEHLAGAIRELAAQPERMARLSKRALARVEEYSFESTWAQYAALYGAVVPGS